MPWLHSRLSRPEMQPRLPRLPPLPRPHPHAQLSAHHQLPGSLWLVESVLWAIGLALDCFVRSLDYPVVIDAGLHSRVAGAMTFTCLGIHRISTAQQVCLVATGSTHSSCGNLAAQAILREVGCLSHAEQVRQGAATILNVTAVGRSAFLGHFYY